MPNSRNNYPELIRYVRKNLEISQEDLARELGVSFGTVNRWENGKVQPSKLALKQLKFFIESNISSGRINPSDLLKI